MFIENKAAYVTATALYDFDGQESDELSFRIDDKIKVLKQDGDWWEGELNGKLGLIPSNYVRLVSESKQLSSILPAHHEADDAEALRLNLSTTEMLIKLEKEEKGDQSSSSEESVHSTVSEEKLEDELDSELLEDAKPSEVYFERDHIRWLHCRAQQPWHAGSKRKAETTFSSDKIGKWLVFVAKSTVDEKWQLTKQLIQKELLWTAKVSTINKQHSDHVIVIYTKDYTDLEDIIRTLDYLEANHIKKPTEIIYYKTDEQTLSGIYAEGNQRPWIYASNTIRHPLSPDSKSTSSPSMTTSEISSPRLSIELVPFSYGVFNMRSTISRDQWQKIRETANNQCEVCQSTDNLECHERWRYDDENKIQHLDGLIALCLACHEVKHIESCKPGLAKQHLISINHWDQKTAEQYITESAKQWRERSRYEWKLDTDHLSRQGITINFEANKSLGQKVEFLSPIQTALASRDIAKVTQALMTEPTTAFKQTFRQRNTLLHEVIKDMGKQAVVEFVKYPAGLELINVANQLKKTPLILAIELKQIDTSLFLIEQGADPKSHDQFKRTVLHHAVMINSVELTKRLLELTPSYSNALDRYGRRPCDYAVMAADKRIYMNCSVPTYKDPALFKLFLPYLTPTDISLHTDKYGKTLLHHAAAGSSKVIIQQILQTGGQQVLDQCDNYGKTALHAAATACNIEGIITLLDAGANCTLRSTNNSLDGELTAFQAACLSLGSIKAKELFASSMQEDEMTKQAESISIEDEMTNQEMSMSPTL